jgi:outer membrane lipoprotein-sorting protein
MDEEARTAGILTRIASETHAPPGVLALVERRAAAPARPAFAFRIPNLRAVALVAAGVILAVLVASTVVPARVSAADLLAKAERAATTGTSALASYRGTITGESWMGEQGKRAAAASSFEQQVAFAAPNKLRLDVTATAPNGAVGHQLLISDGTNGWVYAPDAKAAQPIEPQFVLQNGPFAASSLGAALQSFAQAFDATQQADDTVAGRPAYVLKLVPKPGGPLGPQVGSVRMWLDQATLLQVAAEMNDPAGALLMRWRFATVEVNVDIAASTFAFALPAGTKITQLVPNGAAAGREQAWAQLAGRIAFALFRPLVTVDGLEEVGPGTAEDGTVLVGFRVPNGPTIVAVLQGPPGTFTVAAGGTSVILGEAQAMYRVADGLQMLDFERAGTHLRVQAPAQLPKEALFGVAASLVAVPKP